MKKVLFVIATMLILTGALIAGCTTPTPTATPGTTVDKTPTKLVIGTTAQVNDIGIGDSTMQMYRVTMLSPGLLRLDEKGNYVGVLAESWETTDNQKWTFHLVKNATFHDGTPVTAQDVKFTLEYMPKYFADYKSEWQLINSIETPDNYTLVLNLTKPWPNLPVSLLVIRTLPEHIFSKVDSPKNFTEQTSVIGCGPYKFVSFDKDAGVLTLKANEQYFGGKPAIDTIEIRTYKNSDTMVMALQNGEIDVTYVYGSAISYYYIPKLLQNDNIKFLMIKNLGIPKVLWINNDITPYNDVKFREAMACAINYDELKNLFAAGYGTTPNAGFVPNGTYNFIDTMPLALNLNRSKELLKEAGYIDKDGDGFVEYPNGTKFQPVMLAKSDNADDVRLAELLKKYFNAAGIDFQAKIVDKTTFNTLTYDGRCPDMFIGSSTYWGMQTWGEYGTSYMDSRMYAWGNVVDPEFHTLVDGMLSTSDTEKRKQLGAEIQQYYAEEYPSLALYWNDLVQPYNEKYEGYVASPMFGILSFETFYNLHATE